MKRLMLQLLIVLFAACYAGTTALAAANGCVAPSPTSAQGILHQACTSDPNLKGCVDNSQKLDTACSSTTTYVQSIVNIFLYAAGIVSFVFIIIAGMRYISATGDPTRIKSAKDTLLYAIIGLIVTFVAVPISGFVIKTIAGG